MRNINKIIVHCSASDNPDHDNVETIRQWHIDRGWHDIGYHFIITKDGKAHAGRSIYKQGAHCFGQNRDSIGVCVTGKYRFSDKQLKMLHQLVWSICFILEVNPREVYTHRYFNEKKTCPNFEIKMAWEHAKDLEDKNE